MWCGGAARRSASNSRGSESAPNPVKCADATCSPDRARGADDRLRAIRIRPAIPRAEPQQRSDVAAAASESGCESLRGIRSGFRPDGGIVHLRQDRRQCQCRRRRVALTFFKSGKQGATRRRRSGADGLRAAVVGEPRHDVDNAAGGERRHAGADRLRRAGRARKPLKYCFKTSAVR
jgi:hypothetical protein